MNDWTKWPGGDCPVAKGTLVDVKYRDGSVNTGVSAGTKWGEKDHIAGTHHDFSAYGWGALRGVHA